MNASADSSNAGRSGGTGDSQDIVRVQQLSGQSMAVSRYDQVASLLVAALVLVGVTTALLFVAWLTTRVFVKQEAVPVEFIEIDMGGRPLGPGKELADPGEENVEDLEEPAVEELLTAVTDAVSTRSAALDSMDGMPGASTKGNPGGGGAGGSGGNDGTRWNRWNIQFDATTLKSYATQLDALGIELAAMGGGIAGIEYAFNLAKTTPDRRGGTADEETRLYMTWSHGPLREADLELLAAAGIDAGGRQIVQFYPSQTEQQFARAERKARGDTPLEKIEQTVFGVKMNGNRAEIVVKEIKKRRGR